MYTDRTLQGLVTANATRLTMRRKRLSENGHVRQTAVALTSQVCLSVYLFVLFTVRQTAVALTSQVCPFVCLFVLFGVCLSIVHKTDFDCISCLYVCL
jgi:hypothetical protein